MNIMTKLAPLLMCLFISACTTPLGVKHIHTDGYHLYTSTAANSSLVIRDKNDAYNFCSEPSPDVAVDENTSVSFDVSVVDSNDNSNESEGINEVGLGGRSANVLITRETFYRTCEFISNSNLSDQQKLDLYKQTLKTIADINNQNLGTGTTDNSAVQEKFKPNTTSSNLNQTDSLEQKEADNFLN